MAHHSHSHAATGSRLIYSLLLTGTFVVVETIAGAMSHSLALMSDAGHNLADVLALLLSWWALRQASRPSSAAKTYGYHRWGVLAALVNALSLVLIALVILYEGITRLHHPPEVSGRVMIAVALVAIAINGIIAFWLHRDAHHDLNIRGAYMHMLGDALSAAGVVVAGIIVAATGRTIADPIVSLLIGMLILYSSWDVLRESVDVLLEASPAGMDMEAVEQTIREVVGVLNVHDLHVWTIGPGVIACSCHVVVAEPSMRGSQSVCQAVERSLRDAFAINHSTIQLEADCCAADDVYCSMAAEAHAHCGHSHEAEKTVGSAHPT